MKTSPGARPRWMSRTSIVAATLFASITSSTAVVGLDPAEVASGSQDTIAAAQPITATTLVETTTESPVAATAADAGCRGFIADCVEVPSPEPTPVVPEQVNSCRTPGNHSPTGATEVVTAPAPDPDSLRLRIEVEAGLAIDPDCFAAAVFEVLNDERGWPTAAGVGFTQVDNEDYDLRLILASPDTTDTLCYPARTAGIYSCRKGSRVVINVMRWEFGSDDYANDLTTYRQYLLNHEVGHFLGRAHERCPAPGEPAPVMMQQTKGLDGCLANGWPTEDER